MSAIKGYIRKQVLISFLANLVINGTLAYWILNDLQLLTATGEHGYVRDILLTGLLLSWLFSWINLVIHYRKRQRGELPVVQPGAGVSWLPSRLWLSAIVMAVLSASIAGGAMLALLSVLFPSGVDPLQYAILKGVWTGVLAGVLVVVCIAVATRPEDGGSIAAQEVV
ncbi:hypothetical protein [Parahaliea mediterranea]|uniref:Uncharacterized protein n=1 Tax=Parahaliea mediterranea TaxID=651086 RepID=A0A939IMD8_9GAMM|nr:hypothetical protein [Parahaliea mediterranea]MBN7796907.1 hypothetical protein [Parahaliea mediterranea]